MSMIPQDPFLFSGTIRQNIDPFDDVEDDQKIWDAEFEFWGAFEAHKQLRAAEETGRAQIAAARKRRRDEERQLREEMQSGERYRKHRKWAKEGDAMAVAFFEDAGLRVTELAD